MRARLFIALAGAAGLAGCASGGDGRTQASINGVYVEPGNPTCEDLGLGQFSFKIDPPASGTYGLDWGLGGVQTATVVINPTNQYVDWTATIGIDAVIVKGGPMANVYVYDPEASGGTGLSPPINANNGTPYGISHIDFCFDYEVAVGKTAQTSFTRTYQWAIDKTAPQGALTLAVGEVYTMPYTVVVTRTGFVDSDWAASGAVTIHNPAPFVAEIDAITDVLDGATPVALDCGVTLPYDLGELGTLTCTYALALPDASQHLNEVTVETCGVVGGGTAQALIDFGGAAITERDACVDVADDRAGSLGTACDTTSYEYSLQIGPYAACGTTDTVVNTASFAACDTGASGSDAWTVAVTVPACPVGCTLTPGYWKTHSAYGPAPTDDDWSSLASGPDTVFFSSGKTYYQVLWTAPTGNPYWILAHAYIAAQLNQLGGASDGAVAAQMLQAKQIFQQYTPAYIGGLKKSSALAQQVVGLAARLDAYNNGLIGPGHCSE